MKILLRNCSIIFLSVLLAGCSSVLNSEQDGPPRYYENVSAIPNAVPKVEPLNRYANPHSYVVFGKRYYVLRNSHDYTKVGYASWYGRKFSGQKTSSGELYNPYAMTAASKDLPIPTFVKVTNLSNGRSIIVKVNDRGPFKSNRIIDLSYAAAIKLGYERKGTTLVRVTAIDPYAWHTNLNHVTIDKTIAHHPPQAWLQVGAFHSYQNALVLKHELERFSHQPVHIKERSSHGHHIYRVQIGPMQNYEESDKTQHLLAQHGYAEAITVTG